MTIYKPECDVMYHPALLLALAISLTGPGAQPKSDSDKTFVTLSDCVVSQIDEVNIPAEQAGVIKTLEIRQGDEVDKDQLLLQIDDRDAQIREQAAIFEHRIAEEQSKNIIRIDAAVASAKVADTELEQNEEINRQSPGAVSLIQLKKLDLQREHAHLQVDMARFDQAVNELTSSVRFYQLQMARNDVRDRRIVAPWNAIVVDRMRQQGEWVQQGEPILRLVRMDRLRVEGFLSLDEVSPLEVDGSDVTISVDLGRGQIYHRNGTINFISPRIDGGEYRVRAEFDNVRVENHRGQQRWLLRPGMNAEMSIKLNVANDPRISKK